MACESFEQIWRSKSLTLAARESPQGNIQVDENFSRDPSGVTATTSAR